MVLRNTIPDRAIKSLNLGVRDSYLATKMQGGGIFPGGSLIASARDINVI